jgi:hypothetical protein
MLARRVAIVCFFSVLSIGASVAIVGCSGGSGAGTGTEPPASAETVTVSIDTQKPIGELQTSGGTNLTGLIVSAMSGSSGTTLLDDLGAIPFSLNRVHFTGEEPGFPDPEALFPQPNPSGTANRINSWEIWNEPDINDFGGGGVGGGITAFGDPADYRNLCALASTAMLADEEHLDGDTRRLTKRLRKCAEYIFTLLDYAYVPFDNTFAERQIRPAVILRKNSQSNRSDRGAATQAVLMSVCRTLKLRGLNPTKTITDALRTHLATD